MNDSSRVWAATCDAGHLNQVTDPRWCNHADHGQWSRHECNTCTIGPRRPKYHAVSAFVCRACDRPLHVCVAEGPRVSCTSSPVNDKTAGTTPRIIGERRAAHPRAEREGAERAAAEGGPWGSPSVDSGSAIAAAGPPVDQGEAPAAPATVPAPAEPRAAEALHQERSSSFSFGNPEIRIGRCEHGAISRVANIRWIQHLDHPQWSRHKCSSCTTGRGKP